MRSFDLRVLKFGRVKEVGACSWSELAYLPSKIKRSLEELCFSLKKNKPVGGHLLM